MVRIIQGEIVSDDKTTRPVNRNNSNSQQEDTDHTMHYTSNGSSSALQQEAMPNSQTQPSGNVEENWLFKEQIIFGIKLLNWQLLLILGVFFYLGGPLGLLFAGGLYYLSQQNNNPLSTSFQPNSNYNPSSSSSSSSRNHNSSQTPSSNKFFNGTGHRLSDSNK